MKKILLLIGIGIFLSCNTNAQEPKKTAQEKKKEFPVIKNRCTMESRTR